MIICISLVPSNTRPTLIAQPPRYVDHENQVCGVITEARIVSEIPVPNELGVDRVVVLLVQCVVVGLEASAKPHTSTLFSSHGIEVPVQCHECIVFTDGLGKWTGEPWFADHADSFFATKHALHGCIAST